jgi:hypothetical protein
MAYASAVSFCGVPFPCGKRSGATSVITGSLAFATRAIGSMRSGRSACFRSSCFFVAALPLSMLSACVLFGADKLALGSESCCSSSVFTTPTHSSVRLEERLDVRE